MTKRTWKIGGELEVNRLGFGAMRLTGRPGNFGPYRDWDQGVALVRRAAELGVDFFDSAWAYGPGWADRLLGEALEGLDVVIATKGGVDKHCVVEARPRGMVERAQLERAMAGAPIASVQNRLNMEEREGEALARFAGRHGIAFIPYGPLGAHPMRPGAPLAPKAALGWLLSRFANAVVIPGTTSAEHLEENVAAWDLADRAAADAA